MHTREGGEENKKNEEVVENDTVTAVGYIPLAFRNILELVVRHLAYWLGHCFPRVRSEISTILLTGADFQTGTYLPLKS